MRVLLTRLTGWSAFILAVLHSAAFCAAPPDPLQAVENASSEWIKVRAATVKADADWSTDHALLESTVKALNERAAAIEEKRAQLNAKTLEERTELDAMVAKNKDASGTLATAETRLKSLDEKLLQLRPKLPPRLSAALEMSFRSLAGKELSPGERMQLTMTVLNRCAQFNGAVSNGEEELTLDGEAGAKSLEVIYWGLSHGYALDRIAGKAWLGSPGADRWEWQPRPEAAKAVAQLIAANSDKADPAFISVPVQLKHSIATTSNK